MAHYLILQRGLNLSRLFFWACLPPYPCLKGVFGNLLDREGTWRKTSSLAQREVRTDGLVGVAGGALGRRMCWGQSRSKVKKIEHIFDFSHYDYFNGFGFEWNTKISQDNCAPYFSGPLVCLVSVCVVYTHRPPNPWWAQGWMAGSESLSWGAKLLLGLVGCSQKD